MKVLEKEIVKSSSEDQIGSENSPWILLIIALLLFTIICSSINQHKTQMNKNLDIEEIDVDEKDVSILITLLPSKLNGQQVSLVVKACNDGDNLACKYLKDNREYFLLYDKGIHEFVTNTCKLPVYYFLHQFHGSYGGISLLEILSMSEDEVYFKKLRKDQYIHFQKLIMKVFNVSQIELDKLKALRKKLFATELQPAYGNGRVGNHNAFAKTLKEEIDASVFRGKVTLFNLLVANFYCGKLKSLNNNNKMKSEKIKKPLQEYILEELKKELTF